MLWSEGPLTTASNTVILSVARFCPLLTADFFYLVQWLSPCLAGAGAIGIYLGYHEHPYPSNGPHDVGSTFEQPSRKQNKCHGGS